jgi:hypothetical protein
MSVTSLMDGNFADSADVTDIFDRYKWKFGCDGHF